MKVVRGLEAGREALCSRRGLGLDYVPPHVERRTVEAFGEPLTPVQTVERILTEVREGGDEAVRRLARKLDGADLDFTNLEGCTVKGARVRKAIFPLNRIAMDSILDAVRSGKRLQMAPQGLDD